MKRRRINRTRVESFLSEFDISISTPRWSDPPYFVQIAASASRGGVDHFFAVVISLARVSDVDMDKNTGDTGVAIAIARAKRGLYNILKGKRIHDPLCQGSRM